MGFSKHATYKNVSYRPSDVTAYTETASSARIFAIYYPSGSPGDYKDASARGATTWPFVLWTDSSSWVSPTSTDMTFSDASATTIDAGVTNGTLFSFLSRGFAVVYAAVTGTGTALGGIAGAGMCHAPGGVDGYWESRSFANCYKDAIHVAQCVLFNAETYSLDKNAWCWAGNSAGSNIGQYTAFAPNRAWELGTWGEYRENTIPNCVYSSSTNMGLWEHMLTTNTAFAFPNVETGAGFDTKSATQALVPVRYLREFSPLYRISELGTACIPATYCTTANAAVAAATATWGLPWPTAVLSTPNIHSVNQYVLLRSAMPRGLVRLNAVNVTGLVASQYDFSAAEDLATSTGSSDNDAVRWLIGHIHDRKWDADPDVPVVRRTQVNTTGRVCLPPSARKSFTIEAIDGDVYVAENNTNISGRVKISSGTASIPRDFKSSGAVWIKAVTGVANVVIRENK